MPIAHRTRIGPLDCIVVDGGESPTIPVVICHGYGASYEDLAPLSGEWIALLGEQSEAFRFVFPDAPNSLADFGMPGGRAWWPINMARLAEAVQAARFDELHDQVPPGIDRSRQLLCEMIECLCEPLQGTSTPLVLGGFSQGAMLTMDTALRGSVQVPKLLFQFSGTIVCRSLWQANLHRLQGTSVFQSHGKIDPILPFSSAVSLYEMLCDAGVEVDFHSFVGPHTIDIDSVQRTAIALSSMRAP
jgi:phospholipase/carboxylesterase